MRKLEALYLLIAVFLSACASAPAQRHLVERRVAQHVIVYSVDQLVASGYAHMGSLDLSDGPPFYVLVSEDGFICRVSSEAYTAAATGAPLGCRWTSPRPGATRAY